MGAGIGGRILNPWFDLKAREADTLNFSRKKAQSPQNGIHLGGKTETLGTGIRRSGLAFLSVSISVHPWLNLMALVWLCHVHPAGGSTTRVRAEALRDLGPPVFRLAFGQVFSFHHVIPCIRVHSRFLSWFKFTTPEISVHQCPSVVLNLLIVFEEAQAGVPVDCRFFELAGRGEEVTDGHRPTLQVFRWAAADGRTDFFEFIICVFCILWFLFRSIPSIRAYPWHPWLKLMVPGWLFHSHPAGGLTARVRAEALCDLSPPVFQIAFGMVSTSPHAISVNQCPSVVLNLLIVFEEAQADPKSLESLHFHHRRIFTRRARRS